MELPTQFLRSIMNYFWDFSEGDKRVADWFLMGDVIPTTYICLFYIAFCIITPKILKGKVYQIDQIIRVYNLTMVIVNIYLAYELLVNTVGYYNWICEPVDPNINERSMRIASAIYLYWFTKLIDLLDSVFFILRGKYNQLSFLHIYHHGTMPFVVWFGANFAPGGNSVFALAQNSVIHVIMYTYYFLSSFGPKYRKYLWWKKYLTLMQIIQFSINLAFLINFFVNPGMCEFPHWMPKFSLFYMTSFLVLFSNFYIASYIRSRYASSKKSEQNGVATNGKTALNKAKTDATAKKSV